MTTTAAHDESLAAQRLIHGLSQFDATTGAGVDRSFVTNHVASIVFVRANSATARSLAHPAPTTALIGVAETVRRPVLATDGRLRHHMTG